MQKEIIFFGVLDVVCVQHLVFAVCWFTEAFGGARKHCIVFVVARCIVRTRACIELIEVGGASTCQK